MTAVVDEWRTELAAWKRRRDEANGRSSVTTSAGTTVTWDLQLIESMISRYERKINAWERGPVRVKRRIAR